jgi:hypothetical protein
VKAKFFEERGDLAADEGRLGGRGDRRLIDDVGLVEPLVAR